MTGGANAPKPSLIKIGALDSTQATTLFQAESSVAYASGHLLFLRDGSLMAQPFDPASRQSTGDAFPVAEQIGTENVRYASFSASPAGVLVYGHGAGVAGAQLTWFDRTGKALGTVGDVGLYDSIALSPDERRVAVTLRTGSPPNRDVWVIDLTRSVSSRLTFDPGDDTNPVWSPDGSRIAFESRRSGQSGLRLKLAGGTTDDELLLKADAPVASMTPTDWSRDGRFIAYTGTAPGADLWILPLSGDRKPFAFLQTPFIESSAVFAPDGRWIAYRSDESGQSQVYVQPFPATGGKFQVSKNGGVQPSWRGDGKELFFIAPDATMMAAAIDTTRQFEAGVPQSLFQSGIAVLSTRLYGVTRDGKRFLVVGVPQRSSALPLTVVVNWLSAVQK
ncbi:MAG: PD40 domain-containing protein [Acidobacteria bacterium]|nr:PD40 domain-containing protein [Acidobacteriota bacterium]